MTMTILNAKKKKQLVICNIRLTQDYLGHVELVLIITEKKIDDAKEEEFKEECYWNGYLLKRNTDHVSTSAQIVCSTSEDSD